MTRAISRPGHFPKLLFCFLAVPFCLPAQAWLFPKGEGTVSFSYQNLYIRDHIFPKGEIVDVGHILSHGLIMNVDYSLTDSLALSIGLPYIAADYGGPRPHQLPIDNGKYHPTFQDFRIDFRYNLSKRPAVITPFFEVVIPSHDYEYFAHSAVGRRLREYHVGTNVGRRLNPILPNAYLQARYSYSFIERVLDISPNRSEAEVQLGYFLTKRLSVLGLGEWMHVHRGIDHTYGIPVYQSQYGPFNPADWTPEQWHHHDQILRTTLLDVGGGMELAVNKSVQLFASALHSAYGRNGPLHAAVVTVGISWSFSTRFAARRAFSAGRVDPGNFVR